MKSKTSCFNRTIFFKNILRFWPMWVLYMVILFFMLPVTLYQRTKPELFAVKMLESGQLEGVVRSVDFALNGNILVVFCMAVIFALLIFGYLYSAKNCNMIHALPVSRTELFVTGYFNGLVFLIGPQVIMFLVSLIVCIMNNVTSVELLLYWLMDSMGITFLFLSSAVFCCMLSGNAIAVLVYYLAGNLIYMGVKYLIGSLISTICYGMGHFMSTLSSLIRTRDGFFSPIIYLICNVNIVSEYDESGILIQAQTTGGKVILLYMIPAVILLIAAMIFYRKRQLECAGDIVVFRWMNPVFRWIIAFCAGAGLALIFSLVFFEEDRRFILSLFLTTAFFTWIFFFLSEMILKKRFRIFQKKCWVESVLCAAAAFVIVFGLDRDFFGVEKKIPGEEQVSAILLEGPDYTMLLEDEEDIHQMLDVHQCIIDHKKEYKQYIYDSWNDTYWEEDGEEVTCGYQIIYYLNDGSTMKRYYSIPGNELLRSDPDSAISKLEDLESDYRKYLQYEICKNYEDVTYTGGYIDFVSYDAPEGYYNSDSVQINAEQAQFLYEAVRKDIEEGNYPYGARSFFLNDTNNQEYYNSISLTGRIEGKFETIYDNLPEGEETVSLYGEMNYSVIDENREAIYSERGIEYTLVYPVFRIYTSCTHTIQALVDLGIIEDESELTTWEEYNEW